MSDLRVHREGFPGQHVAVLPWPIRKAYGAHALLKGLMVTDAGYFPHAKGHRCERPQGSLTHLLIACLRGKGWYRAAGRVQAVEPGDLIWIHADAPHAYGADPAEPWTIVWTHFAGTEVESWQQQLGWAIKPPIGKAHFPPDRLIELGLDRVYPLLEHGDSIAQVLAATTALRATFCAMIQRSLAAGRERTAMERTAAVRETIVADPSRAYRLEELAVSAGLSVSYFCSLFREQTGYAPIDFIIRQRIRKAHQLLDTSDRTISAIAAETGFDDPFYFSRCFHRIMGCSPRAYRKSVKA